MAVQAQYPSNVFLLNRNCEESHDYASKPQPGVFLDQSHMFFNNGGSTNSGSMRAQTEPIFDLSQLHNQQQLKLHNHHHRHQQKHHSLSHRSQPFFTPLSDDLAPHLRQEMDQLLQAHAEELRRTLVEKRRRHYDDLLSAAEETVAKCLREKETAVENATRRNAELEARAAQLTLEAQLWQAKAKTQEATAASLQLHLQRVTIGCRLKGNHESNLGSHRDGQAEDAESAYVDPDRVTVAGPSCRVCRNQSATVVILPCRHLCLCKGCDQVVQACPICLSSGNFRVEVNLS